MSIMRVASRLYFTHIPTFSIDCNILSWILIYMHSKTIRHVFVSMSLAFLHLTRIRSFTELWLTVRLNEATFLSILIFLIRLYTAPPPLTLSADSTTYLSFYWFLSFVRELRNWCQIVVQSLNFHLLVNIIIFVLSELWLWFEIVVMQRFLLHKVVIILCILLIRFLHHNFRLLLWYLCR